MVKHVSSEYNKKKILEYVKSDEFYGKQNRRRGIESIAVGGG
jgi:hypothetical protein